MITLKTLTTYLKFKEKVDEFLIKKCQEYDRAQFNDPYYNIYVSDAFIEFKIIGNRITIDFQDYGEFKTYYLPLDILFDDDFYEKLKARFDEERKQKAEETKERELKLLEELKKKYDS